LPVSPKALGTVYDTYGAFPEGKWREKVSHLQLPEQSDAREVALYLPITSTYPLIKMAWYMVRPGE